MKFQKNNFLNICFVHGDHVYSITKSNFQKNQKLIDKGADLIITVHPHIIGCEEKYKEKLIIYSLGDFIMDGKSFDRRRSVYVNVEINKNKITSIKYNVTKNENFKVSLHEKSERILQKRKTISQKLYLNNYTNSYNKNYRKDILIHSLSTLKYIFQKKRIYFLLNFYFMIQRFLTC